MQGNGNVWEWETQHREEYNRTGDHILVGHVVCRVFHKNNEECELRRGNEVFGDLSTMVLDQEFYVAMMDFVLDLHDERRGIL